MTHPPDRLALLIDAENVSHVLVEPLFREIAAIGKISTKRAYGNWRSTHLSGWDHALRDFSITPVQQFSYSKGKNSSDSALIIDAMDLLYSRRYGGFCLVTSDSDFTRLANRLREENLMVYGFGNRDASDSLVRACDKFVYLDRLRPAAGGEADLPAARPGPARPTGAKMPAPSSSPESPRARLLEAYRTCSRDDEGWILVSGFGGHLTQLYPDFDARDHGSPTLTELVRSLPGIFESRIVEHKGQRHLQLRVLPAVAKAELLESASGRPSSEGR